MSELPELPELSSLHFGDDCESLCCCKLASVASRSMCGVIFVATLLFFVPACRSKTQIPRHPIMTMVSRNIERYELVPLIVSDHERAVAVQEVLLEIWVLGREFNQKRNGELFELVVSTQSESLDQFAPDAAVRRVNEREQLLWQQYASLTLRLRSLLSCDEYRRLLVSNRVETQNEESCSGLL